MTRTELPGALFVDAWPDGEVVALVPGSHLETHVGRVAFPRGEIHGPLFLDSTIAHGFAFAGLAHDTDGLMLAWHASHGWVPGPPYVSGRGVYDLAGHWRDALPAGYQFVNDAGVPVSRIDTYGPTHGLSERVEVDGLVIGQGHDSLFPTGRGGVHIWDGVQHRQLDDGVCFFLKRRRIGDRVTVSWIKSGTGAVIWRGTLAELRAQPRSTYKPDVVVPPIVIPPVVPPEPSPMAVPDEEAFVREIAEAHVALLERMQTSSHATDALRERLGEDDPAVRAGEVATDALKGQLCRVIVYGLSQRNANWGLLRKDGGAGVVRADGVRHATDVAFWRSDGKVVDVLSDYDVGWNNRDGDFQPPDRWVAPLFEPDGEVSEPPPIIPPIIPPVVPPAGADVLSELRRLATWNVTLEARVSKLEQRTSSSIGSKLVITGITLDVVPTP